MLPPILYFLLAAEQVVRLINMKSSSKKCHGLLAAQAKGKTVLE
jgi:hypothetical protein